MLMFFQKMPVLCHNADQRMRNIWCFKLVAAPISLIVISLKLMVSFSSAQAVMISSLRAAVSAGEPLDMGHPSFKQN